MSKVAIVNRTNLKNYGSVLQCYALCEAAKSFGHDAEIIWEDGTVSKNYDFRPNKLISTALKLLVHPKLLKSMFSDAKFVQNKVIDEQTIQLFDSFVDKNITRKYYAPKEMSKAIVGSKYDKFICGSDQVWCTTTLYVDPLMYLRFVPKEKRIAYAPSLGRDFIPNYNKRQIKRYINDIPYVSVREIKGKELISELTGRNVPVLLDPTLLLPVSRYDTLKVAPQGEEKYVLCYFLSTPKEETQKKIGEFIKKTGCKVIALNSKLEYLEKITDVSYPNCGPAEFIGFISGAEKILTDSYHGMLFSIMYHKDFWSIEREYGKYDQSSRQLSLLDTLNIKNRYVRMDDVLAEEAINYNEVEEVLGREREKSVKYLKDAIEGK